MISSPRKVRKRDGREVPFDQSKIADAIYRAARSVGGADRFLAEELASVVSLFIDKEWGSRTPSIEDVSDLIEKVLVETGHAGTAKAYILERDRRARIRSALRVRRDDKSEATAKLPKVDAHAHATVSPWSKGKIVEALIVEADLSSTVAEEIAAEVERRVFASGLTRISTSLVRELVDNELFERGFDRVLTRQTTIGLPRYDLDRMVRTGVEGDSGSGSADAIDRTVASAAWKQYSLLAVYPPEVVEAHLAGSIHLGSLGSPTRFQGLEAGIELAADPGAGAGGNTDFAALRLFVRRAAELVETEVVIRGVERLLVESLAARGAVLDRVARSLLLSLAGPAELPAERPRPWLRMSVAPDSIWLDAMAAAGVARERARKIHRDLLVSLCRQAPALLEPGTQVRPPGLCLDLGREEADDQAVLEAAVLAEAAGLVSFRAEPAVGGTLEPLSPVFLRVDINIAQAAFRTRRFETEAVIARLEEVVRWAAAACEARARFLDGLPGRSSPRDRLRRLAPERAAAAAGRYEIGLMGLDAACRIAFDHGPWRDERAREFAREVVAAVLRVTAREARERRLPLACVFSADDVVLARFGKIDFERFPRGRDVHGVPHDGERYLYAPSLAFTGGEPDPREAARLEGLLRRDMVPSQPPVHHSLARDRILFLRCFSGYMRGTDPECS